MRVCKFCVFPPLRTEINVDLVVTIVCGPDWRVLRGEATPDWRGRPIRCTFHGPIQRYTENEVKNKKSSKNYYATVDYLKYWHNKFDNNTIKNLCTKY